VECEAAFEKGIKGPNAQAASDGIGLSTAKAASKAAGGRATLRSYRDGHDEGHVVFTIALPAVRVAHSHSTESGEWQDPVSSTTMMPSASTSANASTAPNSPAAAAHGRRASETDLVCVGCDDSVMIRALIRRAFEELGASHISVTGATAKEILSVVDIALGMAEPEHGHPRQEADIVLLDVNLDLDCKPFAKGVDLAIELRQRGFKGFIALYTAGTSADIQRLLKSWASNCVIMKSLQGPSLKEHLHEEYNKFALTRPHVINKLAPPMRDEVDRASQVAVPTPPATVERLGNVAMAALGPPMAASGVPTGEGGDVMGTCVGGEAEGGGRSGPPPHALLSLDALKGVPKDVALMMLADVFDESLEGGMVGQIDRLEEQVLGRGQYGKVLESTVQSMAGDCSAVGAEALAARLQAFPLTPTVGAIEEMRRTLDLTKTEMLEAYPEVDL